jgi:deoxyribose-phosphate aldolase
MEKRELERIAEAVVERLRGGTQSDSEPFPSETEAAPTESDFESQLPSNLAPLIDHTLLVPEATRADIEELCAEGRDNGFAAVCVDGSWVKLCTTLLAGSTVRVATVAGFPHGAMTSTIKAKQAAELVALGANEIDMVAPVGRIIAGDWDYVEDDIAAVVEAAEGRTVKVILETAVLSPTRIVQASAIAMASGAHFVKTSTGFHPAGGATEDAVALMRAAVGERLGVKAAGGIRDRDTALRMIAAGATRIGTSRGVELVHSS